MLNIQVRMEAPTFHPTSLILRVLLRKSLKTYFLLAFHLVLQAACNTCTTQTQPHQISNTQRTENKTTDVVIQQHSRKLLMMDILMSETCWAHKKWNNIASDIKLVFHSSTISTLIWIFVGFLFGIFFLLFFTETCNIQCWFCDEK